MDFAHIRARPRYGMLIVLWKSYNQSNIWYKIKNFIGLKQKKKAMRREKRIFLKMRNLATNIYLAPIMGQVRQVLGLYQ